MNWLSDFVRPKIKKISTKEIADNLKTMGFDIDKKKILLDTPIKEKGEYKISVRISAEETAKIIVKVD